MPDVVANGSDGLDSAALPSHAHSEPEVLRPSQPDFAVPQSVPYLAPR
jgi:hypothetical protein